MAAHIFGDGVRGDPRFRARCTKCDDVFIWEDNYSLAVSEPHRPVSRCVQCPKCREEQRKAYATRMAELAEMEVEAAARVDRRHGRRVDARPTLGEDRYTVSRFLDVSDDGQHYETEWDTGEVTWEPAMVMLEDVPDMVREFHRDFLESEFQSELRQGLLERSVLHTMAEQDISLVDIIRHVGQMVSFDRETHGAKRGDSDETRGRSETRVHVRAAPSGRVA